MPRLLSAALFLVFLAARPAAAADLAGKLPQDTIFYAQVDVRRMLDEMHKYNTFVDAEAAGGLAHELAELHKSFKEAATGHEFSPQLMDKILDARVYAVIMAKAKPAVKTHSYEFPVEDDNGVVRKTKRTFTDTTRFTFSMVVETTEDAAADFMVQIKAMAEREHKKNPEAKGSAYKEVKVDQGEMISDAEGNFTLGRIGPYLAASDSEPTELWACLTSAAKPEKTLADADLYQRYLKAKPRSVALALVNLESLIVRHEAQLKDKVDEARKAKAAKPAEGVKEGEGEEPNDDGELEYAEFQHKQFQVMKKMFGLDQVRFAGLNICIESDEKNVSTGVQATLQCGEKMSPVMKGILDGGKRFQVPEIGEQSGMAIFLRVGAKEILQGVLESLDEKTVANFNESMDQMKKLSGATLPEIVDQLSGDIYLFVNMVEKEKKVRKWNPETENLDTTTVKAPVPELLWLVGVNDREAFNKILTTAINTLQANPFLSKAVKKRTYQGDDVFLVGDLQGDDALPDGLNSYAVVVVDRYLSFGTWNDVTALIRRAKAAEKGANEPLAAAVAKAPEANLFFGVYKTFIKKMEQMQKAGGDGADKFKMLGELIDEGEIPFADAALNEKIKTSLKRLVKNGLSLAEKGQELGPAFEFVRGGLNGSVYEIIYSRELKK
jgi:hypothetical protein